MRTSAFYLATLKEAPSEAELISHKLMLRAGLIKPLARGLYSWMPLGLRVLRKVERIVREEMNAAGAVELLMPAVQPAELWQESGRWQKYGPELLRIRDRHQRDYCFGPTHEEVVCDAVRRDLKSYRQLPVSLYQIQTKFRDEIRPRFGVMRAREFLMKDAYSFHADAACLQRTYDTMHRTYGRIFERLGLRFRAVAADTGQIGGSGSHEFHVLADSGEDAIAFCPSSDYAANVELAEALAPSLPRSTAGGPMRKVATPGSKTCEAVADLLGVPLERTVKAIAVMAGARLHLLLLRGDHKLNEVKASKLPGCAEFRFASDDEIAHALGCEPGYLGPVGIDASIPVLADRSVAAMADFVCGANEAGFHLADVNFGRDLPEPGIVADLRNVVPGDASPDGAGSLELCRGIEVGHIFQLRTRYSQSMKVEFIDEAGVPRPMEMGCYGIGITRIVGAAIEQGFDERGIVFPAAIAPFEVALTPIGLHKSELVRAAVETLYASLQSAGIDVVLDDRDERPGAMFADMELIGVPHRIVIGERALERGEYEYKGRRDEQLTMIARDSAAAFLMARLGR
ncbi:MAG: proline--tRNA ligase [Proteobacteria bacterium]|nr:proline--tRNA ligase [Burkholderiales bacterium]